MLPTRLLALPRPRRLLALFRNPEEGAWKKLLLVAVLVYIVTPVDLVPDLIPFWGWLDDAGALSLAIAFAAWAVAPYANEERVRVTSRRGALQ